MCSCGSNGPNFEPEAVNEATTPISLEVYMVLARRGSPRAHRGNWPYSRDDTFRIRRSRKTLSGCFEAFMHSKGF
jgi:hypothetical protein